MRLSQIGEFGLIDLISRRETKLSSTLIGIGDDAAVIQIPNPKSKIPTRYLLITTDTFIENVHFKLGGREDYYHLGRKAMAANMSDIAAMGGYPTHALVTIGLPKKVTVEQVRQLYRGIDSLARKHRIDIIGGDTVASPRAVVISITLLGEVEKNNLVLRSTARVGDFICVTGRFGRPASEKYELGTPNTEHRTQEARIIAKSHQATAMIDSSDGLARSILEICKASRVGARIFEDAVPVAKGASLDQALYGGEEYELVFTTSKGKRQTSKYFVVGKIVPQKQGVKLIDRRGKIKDLKSGGYEHFK